MNCEATQAGKELDALIREMKHGQVDDLTTLASLDKLLDSTGSSVSDALAFAAVARKLLHPTLEALSTSVDGDANVVVIAGMRMLNRAIETLEVATAVQAGVFTGDAPLPN